MSELTDDLLEELGSLDDTTDQLEDSIETLADAQNIQASSGELSVAALIIEATKNTQEATLNSQTAAEVNLKVSKEQQMLMQDFEEQSLNLRNTLGKARRDFSSSKGFFVAVLVIVLLTGASLGGLLGWSLYQTGNNQEDFKNEVIDIIQTQAHLNQKSLDAGLNDILSLLDTDQPTRNLTNSKPTETEDAERLENNASQSTNVNRPQKNQAELNQELEELKSTQEATLAKLQENINQLAQTSSANQPELKRIDQQLTNLNQLIKNQNLQLNKLIAQLEKIKTPASSKPTTSGNQPTKAPTSSLTTKLNQISKELASLKAQQAKTQNAVSKLTQEVSEQEKEREAEKANIDKDAYIYRSPYQYNSEEQ